MSRAIPVLNFLENSGLLIGAAARYVPSDMHESAASVSVSHGLPAPSGAEDGGTLPPRLRELCGAKILARAEALSAAIAVSQRTGRVLQARHALELTLARLLECDRAPGNAAERRIIALADGLAALHAALSGAGQARLEAALDGALSGAESLVPLFHLVRCIEVQRSRGFTVHPAGLAEAAPFDLLLYRADERAELACETISADDGRDLHRSAWFSLVDGIDPDLQTWLSAHPGRYLMKMTLPNGLRQTPDSSGLETLATLQRRIRDMLAAKRRADHDEAAVIRLDPLLLAGAQAGELGLMDALREQFGPEAQLAVTRSGSGVFVMAARAGRENHIGAAVRRRLEAAAPTRFTGANPGIVAIFLEDTNRTEWRSLRDSLHLEGEVRQFLTCPQAAPLAAVTAATRMEMLDPAAADSAPEGELRFRNPSHKAAKSVALAPAIRSCG